ncbi:MAG: ferric reductase-like transmembrane domain-containing protein [Phycisphaerae bacterium]|nr:ferric reductase-like transmembrane domain-containing protein [Phycisphaerae bacterium]
MSHGYRAVQWSRPKRVYDAWAAVGAAAFIGGYVVVGKALHGGERAISDEILFMRATGACALLLLHVILCIGPAARFVPRLQAVLFNRRHLGVLTFLVALAHGVVAVGYYHGFGVVGPLESLLTMNTRYGSLDGFPFQVLGLVGLVVLFVMAATSHDFWLKNLSGAAWKRLHMLVYPAYGLLVGHVALGALQEERTALAPALLGAGVAIVVGLHVAAAVREVRRDRGAAPADGDGEAGPWIDAGEAGSIPEDRARTVCAPGGERIAIYRHNGRLSAVTNVCAHQGGPLGEGRVIDGCITCPWHGWQYRAADGCAPPPFTEKVAMYRVRIVAGRAQVRATPCEPGRAPPPAMLEDGHGR